MGGSLGRVGVNGLLSVYVYTRYGQRWWAGHTFYIPPSSLAIVTIVLQYPWQTDLLTRGVDTLSHGCRLNHLYVVSPAVSVDVLLETRRVRLQTPKTFPATGPQPIKVKFPYVGLIKFSVLAMLLVGTTNESATFQQVDLPGVLM